MYMMIPVPLYDRLKAKAEPARLLREIVILRSSDLTNMEMERN